MSVSTRRTAVGAAAVAISLVAAAGALPARASAGQTNTAFAGYLLTKTKGHISTVTDTFVVPTITCKKKSSGVGPMIQLNSTVDKKSNSYTVSEAGVGVSCVGGTPQYKELIEVTSNLFPSDFSVAPGDHVTVTIKAAKSKSTVTLVDGSQTATHTGGGMTGLTAFLGATSIDQSGKQLKLDPFTTIKITKARINGDTLKKAKAVPVTWVSGKTVLAKPGKLAKSGDKFSIAFKHSN